MRIICPNCQARYDIPDAAIPASGREVQCAVCTRAWYQLPMGQQPAADTPLPDPEKTDAPSEAPDTRTDADDAPPKRELDPAVAAILREEAAHEAKVRAREATPTEDTARAPQTPPSSGARERLARLQAAERAAAGPKLTPDTEALVEDPGASLREPRPPVLTELPAPTPRDAGRSGRGRRDLPVPLSKTEIIAAEQRRRRVGFRLGFGLTAGLCCAALALYLLAPHIAAALPQGTPLADLVVEHGNRVQAQLVEVLDRWLARGAAS